MLLLVLRVLELQLQQAVDVQGRGCSNVWVLLHGLVGALCWCSGNVWRPVRGRASVLGEVRRLAWLWCVTARVGKDGVYIRVTYIYTYCIARIQYSTRLVPRLASGASRGRR